MFVKELFVIVRQRIQVDVTHKAHMCTVFNHLSYHLSYHLANATPVASVQVICLIVLIAMKSRKVLKVKN